jgi:hypothetical protein
MKRNNVFVYTKPRLMTGVAFSVVGLLFIPLLTQGTSSSVALGAVGIGLCVVAVWRGVRAGFMSYDSSTLSVRTFLRRSKLKLAAIDSVSIKEQAQVTNRVFPIITLKDGSQYKLSEFFQQQRAFRNAPTAGVVAKAVDFVNGALEQSKTEV